MSQPVPITQLPVKKLQEILQQIEQVQEREDTFFLLPHRWPLTTIA